MKACYHEYFAKQFGKFVLLTLVLGVMAILSSYYLIFKNEFNHKEGQRFFAFSISAMTSIAIHLAIALSYLLNKNFQGCWMRFAFSLVMISAIFYLVLACHIVLVPLMSCYFDRFLSLLAACLLICSPFVIQQCVCLEFFELSKLEKERINIGEKELKTKELVANN